MEYSATPVVGGDCPFSTVTEEAVVGYGLPQLDSSFSSFALLQTVVHVLRTSTFSSSSQGLHIGVEGAVAVGVGARSPFPQPQSRIGELVVHSKLTLEFF